MPYEVVDSNSATQNWREIFLPRAQPTLERPWSWCPGSYAREADEDGRCPHCGQTVELTWRGARELKPHLTQPIGAGVYVIDVGRTERVPGHHCFKIGCSKDVTGRLRKHARDRKHEKCAVLHCLPCPPGWQVSMAVECLISEQLSQQGAEALSKTWEYYDWDDRLVSFCRSFLVPDLVTDILSAVAAHATRAALS